MIDMDNKHIIIAGCGRVGRELARSIFKRGYTVTVVDPAPHAFDRLGYDFEGRTLQGDIFDQDVLKRTGIKDAFAFAAVTNSDSVNIVTARIARDIYHLPHVIARIYNPRCMPIYEKLGLQTVSSSSWGAQRIEQLILHPGLHSVYSAGNGEVQIYEIIISDEWHGHKLSELVPPKEAVTVAIARGGRASLPAPDTILQVHDVIQISATDEGAALLQQRRNLSKEEG